MSRALWQLDVEETGLLFRRGEAMPGQVLQVILARHAAVNPQINAFAWLDEAGATRDAAASDARWRAGSPLGPLDGIVITVKDNIAVKQMPCAWGSELFGDHVPDQDELPVARLRAAGCIILGKTTVSEFTLAETNVHTKTFGITRNPWDRERSTGASSGGAAAALASGIGAAALGTDGGGSIRRPSSHCGLVGLKPSTGRVARRDGLPVILHDCEVIGPMARSVASLAALFRAVARPDAQDRASLAFAASGDDEDLDRAPAPQRILYVPSFGKPVEAEVGASCARAAERLAALGHRVTEGQAPFDPTLFDRFWPTISEAGLAWGLRDRDWQGRVSATHAAMIERGRRMSAGDYIDALTALHALQAQIGRMFESCDLLMTPTAGALPWPVVEEAPPYNRAFTGFANGAGIPAISIPGDPSASGLPIGFQLAAPFGADWLLLRIARQVERHHPWAARWPSFDSSPAGSGAEFSHART